MCRVGVITMAAAGCNHARQSGWQDEAVIAHLGYRIQQCDKKKKKQKQQQQPQSDGEQVDLAAGDFCDKLEIDAALPSGSAFPPALHGLCKFCASYESDIRLADQIKQTLMAYNMALLSDEARAEVVAEMDRLFQAAVDEAVTVYGPQGKKPETALRVLHREYQRASAEVSRLCGERQLAPYQGWYPGTVTSGSAGGGGAAGGIPR
ncbi:hypothetical protein F5X96DRAFT_589591 [Biscogniauxia mediterranea]|nr:hypothetical protein F5X96DRAFT_589591 [Biscogniauxia mediterranea]